MILAVELAWVETVVEPIALTVELVDTAVEWSEQAVKLAVLSVGPADTAEPPEMVV